MNKYVVIDENQKVIGFNLTAKEKDDLFYNIDCDDGGRKPSAGRSWTAIDITAETAAEVEAHLETRSAFLSTNKEGWIETSIELYNALNKVYEYLRDKHKAGKRPDVYLEILPALAHAETVNGILIGINK